ncbi:MAG: hypothetical protein JEZ08_07385 [Clostridiales bacterium]|nr:hypothetical protein [Clostridiales bacterium]
MTFKSYLYKETLELIRTYKLLIISIIGLLFAFTTPVITYFLPKILESQIDGPIDFSTYILSNQTTSIQSFFGDLYEIMGLFIIIFSVKLIIDEFKSRRIVIPFTIGINLKAMVISKYLVYIIYTNIIVIMSIIINYTYSGVVFNDFSTSISMTFNGTLGFLLFLDYHITLVFLMSILTKNTFSVITTTLLSYYVLPSFLGLFSVIKFGPYHLLDSLILVPMTTCFQYSIFLTISGILVMLGLCMTFIKNFELK